MVLRMSVTTGQTHSIFGVFELFECFSFRCDSPYSSHCQIGGFRARLEDFRALKLSKFQSFRALIFSRSNYYVKENNYYRFSGIFTIYYQNLLKHHHFWHQAPYYKHEHCQLLNSRFWWFSCRFVCKKVCRNASGCLKTPKRCVFKHQKKPTNISLRHKKFQ